MKLLQEKLKEAGFEVIDENIRAPWTPDEATLDGIPALVRSLLGSAAEATTATADAPQMQKYQCSPCGYIYDPDKGDPDSGIAPGTPFEALPADWCCPVCGVSKDMFSPVK